MRHAPELGAVVESETAIEGNLLERERVGVGVGAIKRSFAPGTPQLGAMPQLLQGTGGQGVAAAGTELEGELVEGALPVFVSQVFGASHGATSLSAAVVVQTKR